MKPLHQITRTFTVYSSLILCQYWPFEACRMVRVVVWLYLRLHLRKAVGRINHRSIFIPAMLYDDERMLCTSSLQSDWVHLILDIHHQKFIEAAHDYCQLPPFRWSGNWHKRSFIMTYRHGSAKEQEIETYGQASRPEVAVSRLW